MIKPITLLNDKEDIRVLNNNCLKRILKGKVFKSKDLYSKNIPFNSTDGSYRKLGKVLADDYRSGHQPNIKMLGKAMNGTLLYVKKDN